MRIIWLLSYSVSFRSPRSYVMSVVCVCGRMHVCVFLSQSASVEHSRTVQNGGSAWPTEGFIGHLGHLASHFRCFPAVFPLYLQPSSVRRNREGSCLSRHGRWVRRLYRRNREGVQEEPRGIVSVYVTPRAMGVKVGRRPSRKAPGQGLGTCIPVQAAHPVGLREAGGMLGLSRHGDDYLFAYLITNKGFVF